MNLKLKMAQKMLLQGKIVDYNINEISSDMSFLEMLDVLNADLIKKGIEPVSFDHD